LRDETVVGVGGIGVLVGAGRGVLVGGMGVFVDAGLGVLVGAPGAVVLVGRLVGVGVDDAPTFVVGTIVAFATIFNVGDGVFFPDDLILVGVMTLGTWTVNEENLLPIGNCSVCKTNGSFDSTALSEFEFICGSLLKYNRAALAQTTIPIRMNECTFMLIIASEFLVVLSLQDLVLFVVEIYLF
jgi:hypothetical protein